MKKSSSVGRETLTDRIGTPSSANRRGTNSSPDSTKNVTAPSATTPSTPELLGQRGDRGGVVVRVDAHAVGPDARLQRLRGVEHDDLAAVHDRDAVAVL